MKQLIKINIVYFISVLTFWQMNIALLNAIHFNAIQSFFTPLDYVTMGTIAFGFLFIELVLLHKLHPKMREKELQNIVQFEQLFLYLLGLLTTIGFLIYSWIQPIAVVFEWHTDYYRQFSLFYIIEIMVFIGFMWKWIRQRST